MGTYGVEFVNKEASHEKESLHLAEKTEKLSRNSLIISAILSG